MAERKRKSTSRFPFTVARLRTLKPPASGRVYHHDKKTAGLALCVTAAGSKTFFLYRWANGRPTRVRLGTFPGLPLETARLAAEKLNGDIAAGGDPTATRRAKRQVLTLGAFFERYMVQHAKPHKRSWQGDQRQYDQYVKPLWDRRKIDSIHKRDVVALHTRLGADSGHYAANRCLGLLHTVFTIAISHDVFAGPNPAHGIRRFPEPARDRFLDGDELRRFFRALAEEDDDDVRDFLWILLLTGVRRGNAFSMTWSAIDFARSLWRIPDTKSGQPVVVPLVPAVIAILRRREPSTGDSPYVFPGRYGRGHLTNVKLGWKRVLQKAELEDVRLHDLRRTLGSWQALGGSSLQVIGRSLGHKNVATTEIYARLTMDPVRESVEKATAAMLAAGGVRLIEGGSGDGEA